MSEWENEPDRPPDSWSGLRASLMRARSVIDGMEPSTPDLTEFFQPPQNLNEVGRLAHYRLLRCLGEGGMGVVYEAEDTKLQRRVALKILLPIHGVDSKARERFLQEARAMARLSHPHIVTVYEVGEVHTADSQRDLPYLAMQLLQGETLEARLLRGGPLGQIHAVRVAREGAEGLSAAHARGIIHRDIKPSNLWLEEPHGSVKLLDFGLAREIGARGLSTAGLIIGTPAFMSPEQAHGDLLDPRADLFSLGCVLYTILCGEVPFDASSVMATLTRLAVYEPPPLIQRIPEIDPDLSQLVQQMLHKEPAGRPTSAQEVVERLRAIEGHGLLTDSAAQPTQDIRSHPTPRALPTSVLKTPSTQSMPVPAAPDQTRRNFLLAGACLGAAGLSAAAGWWWLSNSRRGSTAPGVSDREILLGMSAAFSGSARELGRGMETGILTYFQHINETGGIEGRQLRLLSLDDGYEPDVALDNVRDLAINRKVFGFIGNVGTPTAEKTIPFALEKKMLFFGAFTGAALLRKDPPDRYVFNYRASYAEETSELVRYLMASKGLRPDQIAVFAQADGYGDTGFNGVAKVLRQAGRLQEQILRVGYKRNTTDVAEAVQELLRHKEIRAVIMVPTYGAASSFIRRVKDALKEAKQPPLIFASVSFVGTNALAETLKEAGPQYPEGVIVAQVVPHFASHASAVLKYRQHLRKYFPQEPAGVVSLEGYLAAAVLVEGLRKTGYDLTTEKLVDTLETMRQFDLGLGAPLSFGPSEHQASHKVWGTILDAAGQVQSLDLD
jgi:serine/threonine protein kinase